MEFDTGLDPLTVMRAAFLLTARAEEDFGIKTLVRFGFRQYFEERMEARGDEPSPNFDYRYNDFNDDTAFWVKGLKGNRTVFLHAFRMDQVEQDLRSWMINQLLGLHIRAGHDVAIAEPHEPPSPDVRTLRGKLVYQGELWVDRGMVKGAAATGLLDLLPRVGLTLAYTHWKPDAVWALVAEASVMRGGVYRAGNPYAETDFITWERPPPGLKNPSEALSIIRRAQLEHMIRKTAQQADLILRPAGHTD